MGEMATVLFVMKRDSPGSLAAQTVRSIARSITSHIKCIARAQMLHRTPEMSDTSPQRR